MATLSELLTRALQVYSEQVENMNSNVRIGSLFRDIVDFLDTKQDRETGKGLSTNDFSNVDKANLATLVGLLNYSPDNVLNTISEVFKILESYPEGVKIVDLLGDKLSKGGFNGTAEDISKSVTDITGYDIDVLTPAAGEAASDAVDTFVSIGQGWYSILTKDVEFNRVSLPIIARDTTTTAVLKIAVLDSAPPFSGNFATMFEPHVIYTESIDNARLSKIGKETEFVLNSVITASSGKRLYFFIAITAGLTLRGYKFTTQNSGNTRPYYVYTSDTLGFSGTWLSTSSGYYGVQYRLRLVGGGYLNEYAKKGDSVKTLGEVEELAVTAQEKADTLAENAVQSDPSGRIFGGYVDENQYMPNSEDKVDNATINTGYTWTGVGWYEYMTNSVVFNRIRLPFRRQLTNAVASLKIAVFDTLPSLNGQFSTVFAPKVIKTINLTSDQIGSTSSKSTTVALDDPIKVAQGKYLFFFISHDLGAITHMRFTTQNSTSTRHNWTYCANADAFNSAWLVCQGLFGFWQVGYELLLVTSKVEGRVSTLESEMSSVLPRIANQKLVCPDIYYAVVGQEKNIYYDSLIKGLDAGLLSPLGVYVDIQCPDLQNASNLIGVRRDRMWQIDGLKLTSSYIGDHAIQISAFDINGNLLDRKIATLRVTPNLPLSVLKYGLCVGDSLTNNGPIVATMGQKFIDIGGVQPVFIGQRTSSGFKHEGYPGYSFGSFVTNASNYAYRIFDIPSGTVVSIGDQYSTNGTTYVIRDIRTEGLDNALRIRCERVTGTNEPENTGTLTKVSGAVSSPTSIGYTAYEAESGNPFWNLATGAVDFGSYRQKMGMGSNKFDIVIIMLGTNDCIGNVKDMTSSANNAKSLVDFILADADGYATKIVLQMPPPDANTVSSWQSYADSIGDGKKKGYAENLWSLRKKLYDIFTAGIYLGKVFLGDATLGLDRYYGFAYSSIQSSVRVPGVLEAYHTNSVHPNVPGYQQLGDGYFLQALALLS